jgi:hypothetical protein
VSNAILQLVREPAVELSLDMGQGSREQSFAAAPKRRRFILSEQVPATTEGIATPTPELQPCTHAS